MPSSSDTEAPRAAPRARDWRLVELEYKARIRWRAIRHTHALGPEKLQRRARTHAWDRERLSPAQVTMIAGRATNNPDLSPPGMPTIGVPQPHPPGSYFSQADAEAFLYARLSAIVLEQRVAVARLGMLCNAFLSGFARRLSQPGASPMRKCGGGASFVGELESFLILFERIHRLERLLYGIPADLPCSTATR